MTRAQISWSTPRTVDNLSKVWLPAWRHWWRWTRCRNNSTWKSHGSSRTLWWNTRSLLMWNSQLMSWWSTNWTNLKSRNSWTGMATYWRPQISWQQTTCHQWKGVTSGTCTLESPDRRSLTARVLECISTWRRKLRRCYQLEVWN